MYPYACTIYSRHLTGRTKVLYERGAEVLNAYLHQCVLNHGAQVNTFAFSPGENSTNASTGFSMGLKLFL